MPDEKPVRRQITKHRGLGIDRLALGRIERGLLLRSTSLRIDANVVKPHVFNLVTRYATDNGRVLRISVIDNDVTDDPASHRADFRRIFWTTITRSEPQEDRRVADVAHRDV